MDDFVRNIVDEETAQRLVDGLILQHQFLGHNPEDDCSDALDKLVYILSYEPEMNDHAYKNQ